MKHANILKNIAVGSVLYAVAAWATAAPMQVSSSSFKENEEMPRVHAGDGDCGGKSVSPQVSWSNLPAGTKSVAVLMFDPDGAKGLGVSHWVTYNIAANRGQLKSGEGQADGNGITVGKNSAGVAAYRGMCPPAGDVPHHYTVTVIATDLEPNALPPGLTREELMSALKGHALGGQSIVGRYAR